MTDTVDTYFGAWNETDCAARRIPLERCLTADVELIDEHGRCNGHEDMAARIGHFHEQVPGGQVIRASGIDEFDGIARYSWGIVDLHGTTVMSVSMSWSRPRTADFNASSCLIDRSPHSDRHVRRRCGRVRRCVHR